jgi:methyl-accepting chemotaxis protein
MVPSIKRTSDLVQEITCSSAEQSVGVSQINDAMNQLNQITQTNASASEELAATAEEMNGQASHLKRLMSFFRTDGRGQAMPASNAVVEARAPSWRPQVAGFAGGGKFREASQAFPAHINEAEFARF